MHKISIALLDPHVLVRKGIISLLNGFENYMVVAEANTLTDLAEKLKTQPNPLIILLDLLLPDINGYNAITWLQNHYPTIKLITLSSVNTNFAISRSADEGISGFVSKNSEPNRLQEVLQKVQHPEFEAGGIDGLLIQKLLPPSFKNKRQYVHFTFTDIENRFMQLCCSQHTYRQIATELRISEKSADKIRGKLFEKLDVFSRTDLCLFILNNGIHCWQLAA